MQSDVKLEFSKDDGKVDDTHVIVEGDGLIITGETLELDFKGIHISENDRRRALAHGSNDILLINKGNDYVGGVSIGGDVYTDKLTVGGLAKIGLLNVVERIQANKLTIKKLEADEESISVNGQVSIGGVIDIKGNTPKTIAMISDGMRITTVDFRGILITTFRKKPPLLGNEGGKFTSQTMNLIEEIETLRAKVDELSVKLEKHGIK